MRVRTSVSAVLATVALCGLTGCSESPTGPVEAPQFSTVGGVGYLQAWGRDLHGLVSSTPTGLFSAVSAGVYHNVAIRSNGTLASWGLDHIGQVTNTPIGTFKAVSAGHSHSVGLRTDGTLAAWGYDFNNQVTNTPSGTFTDVAAGYYHNVAIALDGTLVSWGHDTYNQVTNTPPGTFVRVAAGDGWSAAIATNGAIVSWGLDNTNQVTTSPAGTFTALDAAPNHGVARFANGTLGSWGDNFWGETIMPGGTFLAVSAGSFFSVAIDATGALSAWGKNDYGQTNVPAGIYSAVDAGYEHSVAISVPAYAIPAMPTTITASAGFSPMSPNALITVSWTDASSNETHFQLHRRQKVNNVFGAWSLIASPAANATSYNDANVPQGYYQYRIRACNSLGCSAFKTSSLLNAYVPPAAPSSLVATPFSSTQMALSWNDGSANETQFKLERRVKSGGVFGPWTANATLAANTTTLTYDAVAALTTYQYRMRACNPAGCSAFTVSPQATTP